MPRALRTWLRPLPALVLLWAWVALQREDVDELAPSPSAALARALSSRGLTCTPQDVLWLTGPTGVVGSFEFAGRAVVRAHDRSDPVAGSAAGGTAQAPNDLYIVDVRLSPEGVPLQVGTLHNLTRTSSVDEESVRLRGNTLVYVAAAGDLRTAIHVVDLGGRDVAAYGDFSRIQRWQTALTNLQLTGSTRGVLHTVFSLDPVASRVELAVRDDGDIEARADGRRIVIDPREGRAVEGAGWVRVAHEQQARPGNLVTWAVDRVRMMDFVGDDRMQYVKAIAFTALDHLKRARSSVLGDSDTASDVANDLGDIGQTEFTDPEIGWPPPPMQPFVTPALPGEGQWIALGKDPFITPSFGLPSALVTSFVRPDRDRKDTRVYVTMWDPRQLALHMQAGTVEPLSATGEAGPGQIPRAPEIMRRVVAGFNGGFQAMHGEYGMQVDGVEYLPPKPYAATVMELRDGTTAFGSWPGPPSGDPKAELEVPADVLSYRQNLTALIEHGTVNPWRRFWWGGTPPNWQDNIHTTRSGVCLTKEGFVGYFFGADASADALARAMLQARCDYAVHLDMNPGLVGFELYDVEPSATFKPLGRPLQRDWEYEDTFSAMPDFHYRARKMIRGMSEQNFPQYIHLDGRDFFYLTRRALLPGRDLTPLASAETEPGEGAWRTKGLPQHGFPYAVATTTLRVPEETSVRLRIVRIDPHRIVPAGSPGTDEKTPTIVVLSDAPTHAPKSGLFWVDGTFSTDHGTPLAETRPFDGGAPPRVAFGIDDEERMLAWIELAPGATPDEHTRAAMKRVLDALGCGTRGAVAAGARAFLGGALDVTGDPTPPPTGVVARMVRIDRPAARLYFDTPVVGPSVWQPLQMQRVRYFNRPRPQDAGAGADGATGDAGR